MRYVGRLDYASEGVLILGDAVDIVDILSTSDLPRVYKVKIKGEVTKEIEDAMADYDTDKAKEQSLLLAKLLQSSAA